MTSRLHLRLLAGFWAASAAITLLGWWSIRSLTLVRPLYSGPFHPIPLFRMWTRWDGGWYQQIVTNGYSYDPHHQSPIVFWPTYPLTLRPLYQLGMNPYVAGSLVTMVSTSLAIVLFLAWQRDYRYPKGIERPTTTAMVLAVLAWLVFPYGYYLYGSGYSDALFVFVCLLAFWLVEKDRPLLAGIVGIAATGGRPFGWALTAALALRILERRWADRHEGDTLTLRTLLRRPVDVVRTIRAADLTIGISALGVLGYLGYLWVRFGSPFVFATNESQWGQGAGIKTILKGDLVYYLIHLDRFSPVTLINLALQGLLGAVLVTFGARAAVKRFGLGVTLFVLVNLLPPLIFTRDFRGIGRYTISMFPAFAMLGHLLSSRLRLAVPVLIGSGVGMVVLSMLFARGYYLT